MVVAQLIDAAIDRCPFCGKSRPWLFESDVNRYAVYCRHCGSIGPMGDDEEVAIRLWNDRQVAID